MQKRKTDCGIACVAMLAHKLYGDIAPLFPHSKGISPEDMISSLEDLNLSVKEISKLSGTCLVAIEWNDLNSGHYVVYDSKRKQFLDPLNGIINKNDLLENASIDFIWQVKRG